MSVARHLVNVNEALLLKRFSLMPSVAIIYRLGPYCSAFCRRWRWPRTSAARPTSRRRRTRTPSFVRTTTRTRPSLPSPSGPSCRRSVQSSSKQLLKRKLVSVAPTWFEVTWTSKKSRQNEKLVWAMRFKKTESDVCHSEIFFTLYALCPGLSPLPNRANGSI